VIGRGARGKLPFLRMHDPTALSRVRAEIEELHIWLERWLSGECPNDDASYRALSSRFASDLVLIQPGGESMSVDELNRGLRAGHGASPEFRITIRNVTLRRRLGANLLVTYQEWQKGARNSKPANNGRVSTAILRDEGERLVWLHVHETWLPDEIMAAGPYDF